LKGNAGSDGGGQSGGGGAFGNLAMSKLKSGQGIKESIVSADSVASDDLNTPGIFAYFSLEFRYLLRLASIKIKYKYCF